MKRAEPSHIRNVGTFGHGGEGKTSLVEAILFDTGENSRLGRVSIIWNGCLSHSK